MGEQAVLESNQLDDGFGVRPAASAYDLEAPGVGVEPTSTPVTAERLANFAFPGMASASRAPALHLPLQFSETRFRDRGSNSDCLSQSQASCH